MKLSTLLVLLIVATFHLETYSVRIEVENLAEKCDFSKCTLTDHSKLNVHLVPHTHDDVGTAMLLYY